MMKTIDELAACLRYARMVCNALPIDEDAQREIDRMLSRRSAGHKPRKIARKVAP